MPMGGSAALCSAAGSIRRRRSSRAGSSRLRTTRRRSTARSRPPQRRSPPPARERPRGRAAVGSGPPAVERPNLEHELVPGLADATASGRVRLDAIARWLQDVAYADVVDAGLAGRGAWLVRRARLRVESFPRFGEPVSLRTFCSGAGRVAAE